MSEGLLALSDGSMRPDLDERSVGNARKSIVYPVWIILVLTTVAAYIFDIPLQYQFIPLVASVVFLGLPHGAVDHLMIPKARSKAFSFRWMLKISAVYLVLGTSYLLLWFAEPVLAFVFFIAVTWFHWGEGELYIVQQLFMEKQMSGVQKTLEVAIRGAAPMILPLIAFPEYYRMIAEATVNLFTSDNHSIALSLGSTTETLMLTTYILTALLLFIHVYRNTENSVSLRHTATDITVLTVFFLTVPPILAVGLYFCLWHSLRHAFRYSMLDSESREGLKQGSIIPAFRRFFIDSAPLTAASLVLLGGLYLFLSVSSGLENIVGVYLVLIAVLTLPHVLLMIWLDRIQGLY